MKKKLGMYLICLIYIFELIYTMSAMYFNSFMVTHKIEIFENIYQIAYCMIFIVGILYILLLIYKVGHHEIIDLKKNTGLLFGIVFMDLVLYNNALVWVSLSRTNCNNYCIILFCTFFWTNCFNVCRCLFNFIKRFINGNLVYHLFSNIVTNRG